MKFRPGGFFDLLFNIELKKVGVKIFREISYFSSPNVWDRDRSFRFWDRVSDLNYMLRDSRYKFLNLGFCMQIRMQIRILG